MKTENTNYAVVVKVMPIFGENPNSIIEGYVKLKIGKLALTCFAPQIPGMAEFTIGDRIRVILRMDSYKWEKTTARKKAITEVGEVPETNGKVYAATGIVVSEELLPNNGARLGIDCGILVYTNRWTVDTPLHKGDVVHCPAASISAYKVDVEVKNKG